MENKYKNSKKKTGTSDKFGRSSRKEQTRSRVLSLAQLLSRVRKQRSGGFSFGKSQSLSQQSSSNPQSVTGSKETNTQNRNLQFASAKAEAKGKQGSSMAGLPLGAGQRGSNELRSANSQREKNSLAFAFDFLPLSQRERGKGQNREPKAKVSSSNMTKGLTIVEREEQKRQKPIKPMIPPKSLVIILKEKPEKIIYNRRIIDYKHCGLLQRYIGLGGKILPRRQTRLTAKQQRYIAKTIKSARIMGLLPFVSKEKGFFR